MIDLRVAALCLILFFSAGPALAALSPDDQQLEDKAVAYLDGLSNAKARFEQTDPQGRTVTGAFYLARPGRARFEYDAPSDLLIVSDGKTVAVAHARLKTVQRLPLSSTPLKLFLADHIRLDRGARVTGVDRTAQGFSITAEGVRGNPHGQITLFFDATPMRLAGWAVTDGQGRTTRVTLQDLSPAGELPADLFALAPPPPAP